VNNANKAKSTLKKKEKTTMNGIDPLVYSCS
jgi:hypothetical protein